MARSLKDNITSGYMTAANRLNGRKARRRIVAYVEAYDDIFFWRMVLGRFESDALCFEVMLPSRRSLSRGKKSVLMNLLCKNAGEDMIACVDADYDYLLQGRTKQSEEVCSNPYVLHTYVYAIENYQCYAPSLHEVCVSATLNDKPLFDFEAYLARFSQIIHPFFVWNIMLCRRGGEGKISVTDFNKAISMGTFGLGKAQMMLDHLQHRMEQKVRELRRAHPGMRDEYAATDRDLRRLGVTPETVYLYIQGHHLFDNVVVPMLQKVCERLMRERQEEINRYAVHNTQRLNELSCYQHSTADIIPTLRRNTGFLQSPPCQRLLGDVERVLASSAMEKAAEGVARQTKPAGEKQAAEGRA